MWPQQSTLSHSIGTGGPGGASQARGWSWRGWPAHSTRGRRTGSIGAELPLVGSADSTQNTRAPHSTGGWDVVARGRGAS